MFYKILLVVFFTSFASTANIPKKLRIVTEHLPPYQIAQNGSLVGGASSLIMNELLKRAGIKSRVEVLPWARALKIAESEKNVLIFSIVRSPERESQFKWIGQLHHMEYHFFSSTLRQDIKVENTVDALKYNVAAVRGSFEANSLEQLGFKKNVNLIYTADYDSAWSMVHKGRVDLFYGNSPIIKGLESINWKPEQVKKHEFVVEMYDLYLAASKQTDEDLVLELSNILDGIRKEPKYKRLFNIHGTPSLEATTNID